MRRDLPEVQPIVPRDARPALPASPREVLDALWPLLTEQRRARIDAVVAARTRRVIPVLERLSDPHNVAAVLRSAEAFGAVEVHVVETEERFVASARVSKGTDRWLDVVRHGDAAVCARHLRARGYRVLVASMEGDVTPDALPHLGKVAVVFGNEHAGVSGAMRACADGGYRIPMYGFVESLNVSVAAAITLHAALGRGRHGETGTALHGDAAHALDDVDREWLRAHYAMLSVDRAEEIVAEHRRRR
jgi:tRNA (guanosine-2'-O-)-methyltransferase